MHIALSTSHLAMTLKRLALASRGTSARRTLDRAGIAAAPSRAMLTLHELNDTAKPSPGSLPRRPSTPTQPLPSEPVLAYKPSVVRIDSASSRISKSFAGNHEDTVRSLASEAATPVSLNDLYNLGASTVQSPEQRLENAQFLYHELPIRMAQRVQELQELPYGLSDKEPIKQVARLYSEYVRKMIRFGLPEAGPTEDRLFSQLLESFFLDQNRVIERMAQGVIELRQEISDHPTVTWDQQIEQDVTSILDRFFTARIGLRLLVEQHFTAPQSQPGFSGVIQSVCSPEAVATEAIADASYLCEYHLGRAPEVALYGDSKGKGFTYLPSHMRYILQELLKNAMRSTVETHAHKGGALPMVQIMIAHGDEDVTFKICDEGGGIPRSNVDSVWTYLHSSAKRPPVAEDLKQENRHTNNVGVLAGYGMGLPLSRIYAQYFGGNLDIKSMEGFGTDCYVHLCRLGVNCENLPKQVAQSPAGHISSLDSYGRTQAGEGSHV